MSGSPDRFVLETDQLQLLFEALTGEGYQLLGPVIRDGAIVYDKLTGVSDLPIGWTDEQDGGRYRLKKREDNALFGYAVGPHSWKKFLHPPSVRLWQVKRKDNEFHFLEEKSDPPRLAFIGVRACELHAIAIQDKVLTGGPFVDPIYRSRRDDNFVVAVNCAQAGGTCFCVSMNTGPKADSGFDLALTEVIQGDRHYFVAEIGSEKGQSVCGRIQMRPAGEADREAAERVVAQTAKQMGRQLNTVGIKELLYQNYDHPRWDEVASRCLTCANCTMVCPTCFCTTVEDTTDLTGDNAERWRKWDSCFTMDFSYVHGGSVRATTKSRYRQWMTHKLGTWIDQFGSSGCVGCGRCITWCPVGIDITEEVKAIQSTQNPKESESQDAKP